MMRARRRDGWVPAPKNDEGIRRVSMELEDVDIARADALAEHLSKPEDKKRASIFRRAIHVLYWAFCTKKGDVLIVKRNGREVGRIKWEGEP